MANIPEVLKARNYFYFFDLQAGVILISLIGIVMMIIPIIVNLGMDNPLRDRKMATIQTAVILLYLCIGASSYILLFVSANREQKLLVIIALVLVSVVFVTWVAFLFLSYFESMYRYSCIYDRCPDLHWVASARWRNAQYGTCEQIGNWRSLEQPMSLLSLLYNSTELTKEKLKIKENSENSTTNYTINRNAVINIPGSNLEEDKFPIFFKNINSSTSVNFGNSNVASLRQVEHLNFLNASVVQFRLYEPGADFGNNSFFIASAIIALFWTVFMLYAIYTIFMYYLELRAMSSEALTRNE